MPFFLIPLGLGAAGWAAVSGWFESAPDNSAANSVMGSWAWTLQLLAYLGFALLGLKLFQEAKKLYREA